LKQPDDYRQPDARFRDDETAGTFSEEIHSRRQTVERSFETQSGYLVLIKQLGSRYALSFKRQIGTPPSSSIFLTSDEAKRLSNMFGSNHQADYQIPTENFQEHIVSVKSSSRNRRSYPFTVMTVLFLVTVILCAVMTIFIFQSQIR